MYLLFYLFSLYSLVRCNLKHRNEYYSDEFNKYLSKYNKKFESVEEYDENLDEIEEVNSRHSSFRLGLTPFVDLSKEEFRSTHSSPIERMDKESVSSIPNLSEDFYKLRVSESKDWRLEGKVSSVKDQDECGACYAFAGASAMESKHAIINGSLYDFSVQQLIDCSYAEGKNDGCNGGSAYYVWEYASKYQYLCSESEYPYVNGLNSFCNDKLCKNIKNICSHSGRVKSDEKSLKSVVSVQPVSVAIKSDSLQFYTDGIYDSECEGDINHAVLVVGYGKNEEDDKEYWIIKNSWGVSWGENGYMRLIRNDGSKYGRCDVASEGLVPLTRGEYPIKGMDLKQYILIIIICILLLLILCQCIIYIIKKCNMIRRRRVTHSHSLDYTSTTTAAAAVSTVNISTIPILSVNDYYTHSNINNNNSNNPVVQNVNPSVFVTATSFSSGGDGDDDTCPKEEEKKDISKITSKLFTKGYSKLK